MAWLWVEASALALLHDEQLAEHGGSSGIRDHGLLASALARPQNQAAYGDGSLFDLAAAYAFGIVRNHPFIDGNKSTGFLAAAIFLELNGWELRASEVDTAMAVLALAEGAWGEKQFAAWLIKSSKKRAAARAKNRRR